MNRLTSRRRSLVALVVLAACSERSAAPRTLVPAKLSLVATPAATSTVGVVAGLIVVRVADANDASLSGIVVSFTLSQGSGTLSRSVDTTTSDGTAATQLTLGSAPAQNEVTALVRGVAPLKFSVAGVAGPTARLSLTTRSIRLGAATDSAFVGSTPRDTFGNSTGATVSWVARAPMLVSLTAGAANAVIVHVLRRPGQTYVVATGGTAADSALVSVQDATSPCTFVAMPTQLAVGQTVALDGGAACIRSSAAGAEYALVAHYNTAVTDVVTAIEVTGSGITAPVSAFPVVASASGSVSADAARGRAESFELGLRQREGREIGAHVAGARAWYSATRNVSPSGGPSYAILPASVHEGDIVRLNVNAADFCSNPSVRAARVAAITNGAVVLADTSNPAGGFSDAEYRAFGVAMDTLVNPVDTTAFGAPTDIDGNGRVGILFTRAVNELTLPGSPGGIILGFYYIRDLLPRVSPFGNCPGSNEAEMFYIMVPDPNGAVNGNVRTNAFVQSIATATIGHEYQHLINASRRLYVNNAPQVDEEVWLNEGLSHIAEELLFYRASGLAPRGHIDGSLLVPGSQTRSMFDTYQRNNIARYRQYLLAPESNSPLSVNDALATRGGTWSLLRYMADRTRTTDGDFWRRLVNSKLTGTPNIDAALAGTGVMTLAALRDWSISVFADETVPGITSILQQPSWNFVSAMPAIGLSYALAPRVLADGATTGVALRGGGSSYLRFGVAQNQEALIQVTGSGAAQLPNGMRLTVVRIK